MSISALEAAKVLCSSCAEPAVLLSADQSRRTLFANSHPLSDRLAFAVQNRMVTEKPFLTKDGSSILNDGGKAYICRSARFENDGEPFFMLRFFPLKDSAELRTLPEYRELLIRAANSLWTSAGKTLMVCEEQDFNTRVKVIEQVCQNARGDALRFEELLWYDRFCRENGSLPTVSLSDFLQQFLDVLTAQCDGAIRKYSSDIQKNLAVVADTQRLTVAFMNGFLLCQGGDPDYGRLHLSAKQSGDEITVVLTVGKEPYDKDAKPPVHQMTSQISVMLSEKSLLNRFCETFDASYDLAQKDDERSFTLRMSAATGCKFPLESKDYFPLQYQPHIRAMLARVLWCAETFGILHETTG